MDEKKGRVNWERAKAMSGWAVAVILTLTLGEYVIATNPTFSTVIGPGSQIEPCTYAISRDAVNIFARDCQTGSVAYSGSSATTVIQNAINAAVPIFGSVLFGPGLYPVHGLTIANGSSPTHGVALRGTGGAFLSTVFSYDGSPGGTILTLSGCQWCSIDSIDFNGHNLAATALSIQAVSGSIGSFSDTITNSVFHFATTGILLGASNNYQVSEVALNSVHILDTTIGMQIIGTNTLNVIGTSVDIGRTSYGLNVTNGGFIGYGMTFTSVTVADITLFRNAAPVAIYGGYSETSELLIRLPYDPGQFYAGYKVQDFKFLPRTAGNQSVYDSSLADATFDNVFFGNGATLYFRSLYGPSTPPATKRFVNCLFYTSGGSPINGTANINRGLYKTVLVRFAQKPVGLRATPFASWGSDSGIDPWSLGGSHSAAPTGAFRNYTVDGQNAMITSTGGTGVTINIYDPEGHRWQTGLATLTAFFVPLGYSVTWGAFSGAPTVTVYFVGA